MRGLGLDLRLAVRSLIQRPAFASVALLTLALGIGSNTAIFTLVNALLLRPLPYADPDRLVAIADISHGQRSGVGMSNYRDWRRDNTVFVHIALTEWSEAVLGGLQGEEPEPVRGADVTSSFFDVLGVRPLLGRAFGPEDEFKGADVNAIVLSHGLWQRRYGGRADVIGRVISFDGKPCMIVGVMPRGFWFAESGSTDYYVPQRWTGSGRGQHQYGAIARLRPGVTVEAAQAQMSAIARRIEREYPEAKGWGVLVARLGSDIRAGAAAPLAVLSASVGLLLLLACTNLATLLLVRTLSRSRETAIRAALGAGRARLASALLGESLILGAGGAVLGAWLARILVRGVVARIPAQYQLPVALDVDARVLAFALVLSVAAVLAASALPLARATRLDVVQGLRSGGAGIGVSRQNNRLLRAAIGAELALAALLLVAGALLVSSLLGLLRADLGFNPANLLTMQVRHLDRGVTRDNAAAFYERLLERVRALPGVTAAAAAWSPPLSGRFSGGGFTIEGRPAPDEWRQMSALQCPVTRGYFRTMGIALLAGRDFDERDAANAPPVVVINQALSNRHWPGRSPVGARIVQDGHALTVVGVVADVRHNGPDGEVPAAIYYPHAQFPGTGFYLLVRSAADRAAVANAIRAVLKQADRGSVLIHVRSMEELMSDRLGATRLIASLMTGFALVALVLAAGGLYGLIARWVTQRRHELGVRLALGATRAQLLRFVLWQGLVLAVAGSAIGLVAAAAVTRAMSALLFGVEPRDPSVFAAVAVVLVGAALAACYLPARRASRVDPIDALKCE